MSAHDLLNLLKSLLGKAIKCESFIPVTVQLQPVVEELAIGC